LLASFGFVVAPASQRSTIVLVTSLLSLISLIG
jgi:hypothetical protein